MKRITAILGIFFCIAVSTLAGERLPATVMRVIDGDTLRVWDGAAETTVRLLGVDTPETHPNRKAETDAAEWRVPMEHILRAGKKARDFVAAVAPPGIAVEIVADGEDVYGRALAYVYLPDGRCLNEIIIRYGCGLAPGRYRHARQGEFMETEQSARQEQRGFWKTIWKNL